MLTADEESLASKALMKAVATLSRPRSADETDLFEAQRAAETFAKLAQSVVSTEMQLRALPRTMA